MALARGKISLLKLGMCVLLLEGALGMTSVSASVCPGEDLVFTNDQELSDYWNADEAAQCDTVMGDFTVAGRDVTDSFHFRQLRRIEGTFTVDGTSLQDFVHLSPATGHSGLEYVKSMVLTGNENLSRLRGLHGVRNTEDSRVQAVEIIDNVGLSECFQISGLLNGPLRIPDSQQRFVGNAFGCNSATSLKGSATDTLGFQLQAVAIATDEIGYDFGLGPINLNYAYRASTGNANENKVLVIIGETGGLTSQTAVPVSFFDADSSISVRNVTANLNPTFSEALIVRDTLIADFNNDGREDIFLNAHGTEGIEPFPGYQNKLLLQNANGEFYWDPDRLPEITDFSHGSDFGDIDGDGDLDLFINNLGDDDGNVSYLLVNDGNGYFTKVADVSKASDYFDSSTVQKNGPFSLVLDMDGDGDNDIFTGPNPDNSESGGYFENREGKFFFRENSAFGAVHYPGAFAYRKIDFNTDGRDDILVMGGASDFDLSLGASLAIHLFENKGGGFFEEIAAEKLHSDQWSNYRTGAGYEADVIDINGDGHTDFEVRTTYLEQSFSRALRLTFFNKGNGTFFPPILDFSAKNDELFGGVASGKGTYVDINDDGVMDYAFTTYFPPQIAVQLGVVTPKPVPEAPTIVSAVFEESMLLVSIALSPWQDTGERGFSASVTCDGIAEEAVDLVARFNGFSADQSFSCTASVTTVGGESPASEIFSVNPSPSGRFLDLLRQVMGVRGR